MVAVVLPEYALTEYDMCKDQKDCVLRCGLALSTEATRS